MKIAIFDGDGIGPEIVATARSALATITDCFELSLHLEDGVVGLAAHQRVGTTFPDEEKSRATSADGIILGPLSTSDYLDLPQNGVNVSAWLRKELELFANIRPVDALADLSFNGRPFRITLFRENTEGFYAVRTMHAGSGEFAPDPDTAFALRKVTTSACQRIADSAFGHARRAGVGVCAVHKANVLKLSDGIFLRACRAEAKRNPAVPYREEIVDAAAAGLVSDPASYEVIVTTNLFGDILSNQIGALGGGLGIAGSLNVGMNHAMAQAAHGSAPDIAGNGLANPTSILLSTAMLLEHLSEKSGDARYLKAAGALQSAVIRTIEEGPNARTPDLGGTLSTRAFAEKVLDRLKRQCVLPRSDKELST